MLSVKGQRVNILSFMGHLLTVIITQLCYHAKESRDNELINEQKLYTNKILFIETNGGPDLTHGLQCIDSCSNPLLTVITGHDKEDTSRCQISGIKIIFFVLSVFFCENISLSV